MLEIISKSMYLKRISFCRTKWIWMFAPSFWMAEMNCNRACAQSWAIPKRNLQHGGAKSGPSPQLVFKSRRKEQKDAKNIHRRRRTVPVGRPENWAWFCVGPGSGSLSAWQVSSTKEASPRAVFSCNTCELCCCRCGTLGNGLILCWFDEWLSECGTGLDYFEFSPFSAKYLTTCTVV